MVIKFSSDTYICTCKMDIKSVKFMWTNIFPIEGFRDRVTNYVPNIDKIFK